MANLILWNTLTNQGSNIRPMSCYQLASWLRQFGYTVKVIDFCYLMKTEELVAITEKNIDSDTLAIGVSSTFWNHPNSLRDQSEPSWAINARTLLKNKKVHWLLGGPYSWNTSYRLDWIKFHGNAEDALLKWMDENSSKLVRRDLFDITKSSIFFSQDDFIQPYEVLPIELGRGCQFKCRFCSFSLIGKKKGTYIKDSSITREELIRNYNEYGVTRYCIMDDTVNESEEKIQELADIAQSLPFKFEWVGFNRVDLIWSRPGTIQLLKDSGLRSTYFGIESFHPAGSKAIGKGWNGKQGKEFLLKLKEEWKDNITWSMGFIIGLPGEGLDSIEETEQWCIDNNMDCWWFSPLIMDRDPLKLEKSEFEINYEKFGYSYVDDSYSEWKNDIWSSTTATECAIRLNKRGNSYRKIAGFALTLQSSLGYSFDELNGRYMSDILGIEINQKVSSFVDSYVQNQLK